MVRVRFREYALALIAHTVVAATALAYDQRTSESASNILTIVVVDAIGMYGAYIAEKRERRALLLDHQLSLARVAVKYSCELGRCCG